MRAAATKSRASPDWPDDACLGAGLPPGAEQALALAGQHYSEPHVALAQLEQARRLAPGHFAVDIGLYRFHFYRGELRDALRVAEDCLGRAARAVGATDDWRELRADSADFGSFSALPRFLLFSLKGYAYLQLRLGEIELGRAALAKLAELDVADRTKGSVLSDVLCRDPDDD